MKLQYIFAFVIIALLVFLFMPFGNKQEKMYSLAFRKKHDENDYFFLNQDYTFEEYAVNCHGRYWLADPFLFEHDEKVYVFYEAYDLYSRKGSLGYSILNPENKTLTPPHIILERKFN